MPSEAKAFRTVIVCLSALLANGVHAEGIDTEHLFGFMIGTDVGSTGEREFQSQTTERFSKSGGRYRAIAANWPGRAFPWISATGSWTGIQPRWV